MTFQAVISFLMEIFILTPPVPKVMASEFSRHFKESDQIWIGYHGTRAVRPQN
jgi:hypothetical protein